VGAKLTFSVADCPGETTCPVETPLALKPGPAIVRFETVTFELPPLVNVTGEAALLPTLTVPKFIIVKFGLNSGALEGEVGASEAPVPATATRVGALDALLSMVTVPVTAPVAIGSKRTEKVAVCPAAKDMGSAGPLVWKAGLDELSEETSTAALPVLLTAKDAEFVLPRLTLPKSIVGGRADIMPAAEPATPVPVTGTCMLSAVWLRT
jgi:hypothetical protein